MKSLTKDNPELLAALYHLSDRKHRYEEERKERFEESWLVYYYQTLHEAPDGTATLSGDKTALGKIFSTLVQFDSQFEIVPVPPVN